MIADEEIEMGRQRLRFTTQIDEVYELMALSNVQVHYIVEQVISSSGNRQQNPSKTNKETARTHKTFLLNADPSPSSPM